MESNIKENIANNITALRKSRGMTQTDVAKALNYSDKSISKWENGDSLPDITVLAALAQIYGVSLDYFVQYNEEVPLKNDDIRERSNKIIIMCLSVSVVLLIATVVFVYSLMFAEGAPFWQAFVWAVPLSSFVLWVFAKRWSKNKVYKAVLLSIMFWSLLTCVFLQIEPYKAWFVFFLGIPIQIIIWLASKIQRE
jgi:transcriptional regulator with XRE-family HTH domain